MSTKQLIFILVAFYLSCIVYVLNIHYAPEVGYIKSIISGKLENYNYSSNMDVALDNDLLIWANIYKNLQSEFALPANLNVPEYFNTNFEGPDYDTNEYMVPKREKYCWANFLQYMLNSKQNMIESEFLFTDYVPSNSLKYELSKRYGSKNGRFYNTKFTRRIYESRKRMDWDPKIRLYFTNSTLHYRFEVGKHYQCPFQMANHALGQGSLTRPDLLADLMIDRHKSAKKKGVADRFKHCYKTDEFYPETYRLYKRVECKMFFKKTNLKEYFDNLKSSSQYVWKIPAEKKTLTLDYLEDTKLKETYSNGKDCGKLEDKQLVQTSVSDQLQYEDGRSFKIRTFVHFASLNPLVVYYEDGYALLERSELKENFMDLMITVEDLGEYLLKNKIIKNSMAYNFAENIKKKAQDIIRRVILLSKNKLLKDGRMFQVFAFDFILDKNMKLWVADVKYNPLYSQKNKDLVERILDRQLKVLQHRSSLIYDFFQDIKGEVDTWIEKEQVELDKENLFEKRIRKSVDFKKKRLVLRDLLKSYPEQYDKHDQEALIFDETRVMHLQKTSLKEKVSLMFLEKFDSSCVIE